MFKRQFRDRTLRCTPVTPFELLASSPRPRIVRCESSFFLRDTGMSVAAKNLIHRSAFDSFQKPYMILEMVNDSPQTNVLAQAARIALWIWVIYCLLLIPVAAESIVTYSLLLYLVRPLALLMLIPIIGFATARDWPSRWSFLRILCGILLVSIIVNWTLVIGVALAELLR